MNEHPVYSFKVNSRQKAMNSVALIRVIMEYSNGWQVLIPHSWLLSSRDRDSTVIFLDSPT